MKRNIYRILYLIVLTTLLFSTAEAQLKVSLNVSSRPDPYLSNWAQKKEIVIVTIINSGSNSVKAKFDCKINKDGALIVNTKPEMMKILDVPTGVSQYYGEDLVPFEAAKIQSGADKTAVQTGMLSAGLYEFCVALLDVSNVQITTPVCKSFSIQSYQAPTLLQPENNAGLRKGERPIFRWTPVSPRPQFPVTYTIQVFEVLEGQTPINAFRSNRPILENEGIVATQFLWSFDVELPNPKLQHIWTVRAIDEKGNSIGEPDGYATPFTFADCCFYPIGCCPPDEKVVENNPKDSIDKKDVNNTTKNSDNIDPRDSMSGSRDKTNKDPNKDSLLIKQGNLGNSNPNSGNPTNYASCPWNLYPNPDCGGGVQCYPCLGCCMCPGTSIYNQQFCDIITGGTLNIMNVHPNAFLSDYVYFDGKVVKSQNVDFSQGGTVLLQLVDRQEKMEYIPSYLAGKTVVLESDGSEVSRGIVDKNGSVQLRIKAGLKLQTLQVRLEGKKFSLNKTTVVFGEENFDTYPSEVITPAWYVSPNPAFKKWRRLMIKSLVTKPSEDMGVNKFPVTTLAKFDKEQIRINETKDFSWINPEIEKEWGVKELQFSAGEFVIQKDPKSNDGLLSLKVKDSKASSDRDNYMSAKKPWLDCEGRTFDCIGVGFQCLVFNPTDGGINMTMKPQVADSKFESVDLRFGNNKRRDVLTIPSDIMTLPNEMGFAFAPVKEFSRTTSRGTTNYSMIEKYEYKKYASKPITYLIPGALAIAVPNPDSFEPKDPSLALYWCIYKDNSDNLIGLPMPLVLSPKGDKEITVVMRKKDEGGGTTDVKCKPFVFKNLEIDRPTWNLPDPVDSPIEIGQKCRYGEKRILVPLNPTSIDGQSGDSSPSIVQFDAGDVGSYYVEIDGRTKPEILDDKIVSKNYVDGYGMVVVERDFGISTEEANVMLSELFAGSQNPANSTGKKNELVSVKDMIKVGTVGNKSTFLSDEDIKKLVGSLISVDIITEASINVSKDNVYSFYIKFMNAETKLTDAIVFDSLKVVNSNLYVFCPYCPEAPKPKSCSHKGDCIDCYVHTGPYRSGLYNCPCDETEDPDAFCFLNFIVPNKDYEEAYETILKSQARGVQPNGNNDSDPRIPNTNGGLNPVQGKGAKGRDHDDELPPPPPPPPLQSVPTYGTGIVRPLLCKCCGISLTETSHDEAKCCKEKENIPEGHYTNPDGTLKYFEYTSEYVITDKKVCEAFGVKELVIAAGIYRVEYNDPKVGGTVKFRLKTPIPVEKVRTKNPIEVGGTNPKGMNCSGPGNSCFFVTDSVGKISLGDTCRFTIEPGPDSTGGWYTTVQVSFRGTGSPKSAGF